MGEDYLGNAFAGIMLVALMIALMAMGFNTIDDNTQTYASQNARSFVDNCRAMGAITPQAYNEVKSGVNFGADYQAIIYVRKHLYYPVTDDAGNLTGDIAMMYDYYTDDMITQDMFLAGGEKDFVLENGDQIGIEIRRTGPGFTAIAGLFGLSAKSNAIIYEYSGTVYHSN